MSIRKRGILLAVCVTFLFSEMTRAEEAAPADAQEAAAEESFQDDSPFTGLPEKYDMRETGTVTPVKLQWPWGSCWSFGTIAAAETSILSALGKTYQEFPLDLSEKHAAWFARQRMTADDDPAQAGKGRFCWEAAWRTARRPTAITAETPMRSRPCSLWDSARRWRSSFPTGAGKACWSRISWSRSRLEDDVFEIVADNFPIKAFVRPGTGAEK